MKPPDEPTDELCEKCGRNMVIKLGRFGRFLACPGFPECKHTEKVSRTRLAFLPQMQGRRAGQSGAPGRHLLWLQPLSELRLHSLEPSAPDAVPRVRRVADGHAWRKVSA